MSNLPESGFIRLSAIIGDQSKKIPAIIPIGRTSWYAGIKSGIYPPPIKLNKRTSVWRVEDIRSLVDQLTISKLGA